MKWLLTAVLLIIVLLLTTNREPFTEIFGFSGYKQPTGLCTYIIETTSVKKYAMDDKIIYECMFMTVKNSGFAFGFSVVASYEIINDVIRLISLRSQPLDVQTVSDVTPFIEGTPGQDFVKYELIKENAIPTQSELEVAKNKLKLL
jgi:hypothetical protein